MKVTFTTYKPNGDFYSTFTVHMDWLPDLVKVALQRGHRIEIDPKAQPQSS